MCDPARRWVPDHSRPKGRVAPGDCRGSRVRTADETLARNNLKTVFSSRECPVCGKQIGDQLDRQGSDSPCSKCGHASWFRIQEFGNTVVINLLPSLDLECSDLSRAVEFLIRRRAETNVVVNLSLVQYIGSTFLDRLILAKRRLSDANGRLILCGFNPVIEEIFRVTKLDGFFEIVDEDSAVPNRS
jgi:anti-sigma B factor antagonist